MMLQWNFINRLSQVGVSLILVAIGFLAGLNDVTSFSNMVHSVINPLITMQGVADQHWRSLPATLGPFLYTFMFLAEFSMGIMALMGVLFMLKNIHQPYSVFEHAKRWVYLACGWGIIIWGLFFFEGGDWFLTWKSSDLAFFQQGALMYVIEILTVFIYLKLSDEKQV